MEQFLDLENRETWDNFLDLENRETWDNFSYLENIPFYIALRNVVWKNSLCFGHGTDLELLVCKNVLQKRVYKNGVYKLGLKNCALPKICCNSQKTDCLLGQKCFGHFCKLQNLSVLFILDFDLPLFKSCCYTWNF